MSFYSRYPVHIASVVCLVAASGAALAGSYAMEAGQTPVFERAAGPVSCVFQLSRRGGTVALTGLARVQERMTGEYALDVSGPGTTIRQAGPFSANPDSPEPLGSVTLSAQGAGYDAELTLAANGHTVKCKTRVGGGI